MLIIFEMSNNHNGSLDHAKLIVDELKNNIYKYKQDFDFAVKLQFRDLDTFIHPDFKGSDIKHIKRFEETRLTDEEFKELCKYIKSSGFKLIVTPFDENSVEKCIKNDVDYIKVASCSALDWPLLDEITKFNKPVIVSTGGLEITDIDKITHFFSHKNVELSLLHCVALYPTPNINQNLNFIDKLKRRYPNITIGYSGHEEPVNFLPSIVALSKGSEIIERHVGFKTENIKLNKYSIDAKNIKNFIEQLKAVKEVKGNDYKDVTIDEIKSLRSLQRGVYAKQPINNNTILDDKMVYYAMPCQSDQLTSGELGQYRSKYKTTKYYMKDEHIYEFNTADSQIDKVRYFVHKAKGMLNEAGVNIGEEYEIELSHHYGLEDFAETGAVLINLINREYCKKIIIMFRGQMHPEHMHKTKEETFQILYGDLILNVNNKTYELKAGDLFLVERFQPHSFTTDNGVIFEEVSTTSIKGDSFYTDTTIYNKDPMERKTQVIKI